MELTEQEFAALQRSHLAVFAERCFVHLNPGVTYLHNWHLDLIAYKLEQLARGEIKRLIINVPPRSMKSIMASVAFPAWILGSAPTKSLICVSYSQDLADKHAEDTRAVMQSAWYQSTFPTRLASKRPSAALLKTTSGGVRRATSVGGTLTGLGADIILIDDPLKPDDARRAARKSANDWLDNTLLSRLNDKQEGAIVIIMQRLHLDDVVGHVLQHGGWEVVNLPAIAQEDESFNYLTWYGQQQHTRKAGEALQPEREPLAILEMLRKQMGSYEFAGQYLQQPIPEDGGIVKFSWIHRYEEHEKPSKFDQIIHSWDTASKATELSDFSVCTVWGIANKKTYLLDVFRDRLEFPNLKRKVIELYRRDNPQTILIEDQASGIQLIQELKEQQIYCVKAVKTQTDKVMRMKGQTARIENGEVLFPKEAPWVDTYIAELTVFPNGRNDDQVDSTSQALEWIFTPVEGFGLLEYYRQEYEKMQAGGR
jgi:predicted phage terminase large subunit-like protein